MAMPEHASKGAGVVFITLTLLGWAAVPLFLKHFVEFIDGWTANGWRYGLSALFWCPVLFFGLRRGTLPPGLWKAALVPSLFNCLGQICFAWAPYYIDPGLMAFLLRFQIILIAFGAYLLFPSERSVLRSKVYWIGIVAVFVGSAGTILLGDRVPTGATAFGVFLALLAGLLYGGYALAVRYYLKGISSIVSFAAISQYSAIGMVGLMLVVGDQAGAAALSMGWSGMAMLTASAFIGIALAHVFFYSAIARLGVSVASGVILLAPFLTAIGSYLLFEERLTAWQWTCGTIAMLGAAFMLRVPVRAPDSPDGAY